MGACTSKTQPIKSQKSKTLLTNQTTIQDQSKEKKANHHPKRMTSLQTNQKESQSTGKFPSSTQKTKKKINKEVIAKTYSVLQEEFIYSSKTFFYEGNDLYGKVQQNFTGQVRTARTVPKTDEAIKNIDEFINSISENCYSSSHFANVIEIFQDAKSYYIIQQYCSGGLLSSICGKISEEEAIYIISQILLVIQEIHNQGSCHGNLTINSFALLDQSKHYFIKLIDITPIFYIKEKKDLRQTQLSDIQQVGVILFQLITNRQISEKTVEMILRKPKDLPNKTEWYQITLQLVQAYNLQIYENVRAHQWFDKMVQRQSAKYTEALFNKSQKKATYLQERIIIIMNQLFYKERQQQIEIIFKQSDSNGSGTLSKEELGDAFEMEEGIDELFKKLDIDGNGEVDINEFIFHSCDKSALITDQNLSTTFSELQKKGFITSQAINKCLVSNEEQLEKDMVAAVNIDKLNEKELKTIMMSLL